MRRFVSSLLGVFTRVIANVVVAPALLASSVKKRDPDCAIIRSNMRLCNA